MFEIPRRVLFPFEKFRDRNMKAYLNLKLIVNMMTLNCDEKKAAL